MTESAIRGNFSSRALPQGGSLQYPTPKNTVIDYMTHTMLNKIHENCLAEKALDRAEIYGLTM